MPLVSSEAVTATESWSWDKFFTSCEISTYLLAWAVVEFLLNVGDSSMEEKLDMIEIIAKEIVHLWFGDLVTLEWWDQTWLKEGLATFMSYKAMPEVDQPFDSWGWFVATYIIGVMKEDSLNISLFLSNPVTSRDDI